MVRRARAYQALGGNTVASEDLAIHRSNPVRDMRFYDDLPAPLRQALANAPDNLAAEAVWACWTDPSFGPDADIVTRMRWFVEQLAA